MAHFAELDASDKVIRVIVIDNNNNLDPDGNENELYGAAFCRDLLGGSNGYNVLITEVLEFIFQEEVGLMIKAKTHLFLHNHIHLGF